MPSVRLQFQRNAIDKFHSYHVVSTISLCCCNDRTLADVKIVENKATGVTKFKLRTKKVSLLLLLSANCGMCEAH